jgi:DNA polymerase III epsilon subunit-like protein
MDVMIDLETMGVGNNSAIVSIAAVRFDIQTGKTHEFFETNIDLNSSLKKGFKVSGSTILWWLSQSEEARGSLVLAPSIDIEEALTEFAEFLRPDDVLWSNGLRFDIALLEDAYQLLNMKIPWDFHNERDVRTLVAFAPGVKDRYIQESKSQKHIALNDCLFQIQYCSEIYNKIKLV